MLVTLTEFPLMYYHSISLMYIRFSISCNDTCTCARFTSTKVRTKPSLQNIGLDEFKSRINSSNTHKTLLLQAHQLTDLPSYFYLEPPSMPLTVQPLTHQGRLLIPFASFQLLLHITLCHDDVQLLPCRPDLTHRRCRIPQL